MIYKVMISIRRSHNLDVQISASGFTSQVEMASDEEELVQEFEKVLNHPLIVVNMINSLLY